MSCCNICGSELNDSSIICPHCTDELSIKSVFCDNCSDKLLVAIKLTKRRNQEKCPHCNSRKLKHELITIVPDGPDRYLKHCTDCNSKFLRIEDRDKIKK